MSRKAAGLIAAEIQKQPGLLLCASAGSSPAGTYAELAKRCRRSPHLYSRLRVLQIDEWGGLPPGSPATCKRDLESKLVEPLQVAANRFIAFETAARDVAEECRRIARSLARVGPIDVCILGLGTNGHVAMNEPGVAALPFPHKARLTGASQQHAMLKHLSRKPKYGMTLGMADILNSRKILLLVSGRHKRPGARTLARAVR